MLRAIGVSEDLAHTSLRSTACVGAQLVLFLCNHYYMQLYVIVCIHMYSRCMYII